MFEQGWDQQCVQVPALLEWTCDSGGASDCQLLGFGKEAASLLWFTNWSAVNLRLLGPSWSHQASPHREIS